MHGATNGRLRPHSAMHNADRLMIPPLNAAAEIEGGSAWLRERLENAHHERVVIGLSGGVDSAVTAMWASRALGSAAVILVSMPYGLLAPSTFEASTIDSVAHARRVAAQLGGVDYRELDIAPTVDAEAEVTGLAADLRKNPADIGARSALGNLKARVRAVRLRYFANRLGALLLGTENKTEHYLGYFTIGGDEESDLELLGSYLKAEVVQLARALGVPPEVIDKAPSADLWGGQTDEGELGFTYGEADHVLHATGCTSELSGDAALRCVTDLDTTNRILARVRATEFKRAPKPVYPRTTFSTPSRGSGT